MFTRRLSAAALSAISVLLLWAPAAEAAPSPSATPTPTATAPATATATRTPTATASASPAATASPTATPTATSTAPTLDPTCDQLSMMCSGGPGGKKASAAGATPTGSAAASEWGYINTVAPWAVETMNQYAVPASVTIAQAILESGWGQSGLTIQGHAHFGIKCSPNGYMSPWQSGCLDFPTQEWDASIGWYTIHSYFRSYATDHDSFMDHGLFLVENTRYASAFSTNTADDFIREVQRDGYATDPQYANSVIGIMQNYNLYMYDRPGWQIQALYGQMGGSGSWLGATTTDINCGLINGGCWQGFEGGTGYWSPASGAHMMRGAILTRYGQLGYERSPLGYPTSEETCGLKDNGCYQNFQNGIMYWSQASGAQPVWGGIAKRYASLNWENSKLGYPTDVERCGLKDGGCVQSFQGGLIYWTPATAGQPVWGAIATRYASVKWEQSPLGYPIDQEVCGIKNGGCYQAYQGGTMYWTSAAGAQPVWGAMMSRYASLGYENSVLGYPTAGETCGIKNGGCTQPFQGGSLYWSASTDVWAVTGAVRDRYLQLNGYQGPLGLPTGAYTCGLVHNGCYQKFEGGVIYSSGTAGTWAVTGAVKDAYAAVGFEHSQLGLPTGAYTCGLKDNGCYQNFEGGVIYTSPTTGTHAVWGAILTRYAQLRWEQGPLGLPTGPETCGIKNGGCWQPFQGGLMYWSGPTGAWESVPPLRDAYVAQGSEHGSLGMPTSEVSVVNGVTTQRYEGGTLNWTSAKGVWRS